MKNPKRELFKLLSERLLGGLEEEIEERRRKVKGGEVVLVLEPSREEWEEHLRSAWEPNFR